MPDVHWYIGRTVGSGVVLCGFDISRGLKMAEREGFEPPIPVKVYTLSRRAPSATRPSLRAVNFHLHFTKEARFHRLSWLDVTELSLAQLPFRVEASDWSPHWPYGALQHREFECR